MHISSKQYFDKILKLKETIIINGQHGSPVTNLSSLNLHSPLIDRDMLPVLFLVMVAINPSMEFLYSTTDEAIRRKTVTSFFPSIDVAVFSELAEKYVLGV